MTERNTYTQCERIYDSLFQDAFNAGRHTIEDQRLLTESFAAGLGLPLRLNTFATRGQNIDVSEHRLPNGTLISKIFDSKSGDSNVISRRTYPNKTAFICFDTELADEESGWLETRLVAIAPDVFEINYSACTQRSDFLCLLELGVDIDDIGDPFETLIDYTVEIEESQARQIAAEMFADFRRKQRLDVPRENPEI